MRKWFSREWVLKNINNVMVALIVATVAMLIVAGTMVTASVKSYIEAKREGAATPVSIPLLATQSVGYTPEEYTAIGGKLVPDPIVKVEVLADRIRITAGDVNKEPQWRHAVSDMLALDKRLEAVKVCGSVVNACGGAALSAEIVGVRHRIFIKS